VRHAGFLVLLFALSPAPAANDDERDRALLKAAESCVSHGAVVTGIRKGVVQIEYMHHGDAAAFERCYQEAAQRALEALAVGRLAANAVDTSAPIEIQDSMIFVSAVVNGSSARLLLDTGATKTIIRPNLAQRAGIEPGRASPQATMIVVGGGQLSVPLVRARSLAIGQAEVHAIEIGVYEATPDLPDVDGILGIDYLGHFAVTIDRHRRTLLLAPLRSPRS
jgi:predicted aspartyl protease